MYIPLNMQETVLSTTPPNEWFRHNAFVKNVPHFHIMEQTRVIMKLMPVQSVSNIY